MGLARWQSSPRRFTCDKPPGPRLNKLLTSYCPGLSSHLLYLVNHHAFGLIKWLFSTLSKSTQSDSLEDHHSFTNHFGLLVSPKHSRASAMAVAHHIHPNRHSETDLAVVNCDHVGLQAAHGAVLLGSGGWLFRSA